MNNIRIAQWTKLLLLFVCACVWYVVWVCMRVEARGQCCLGFWCVGGAVFVFDDLLPYFPELGSLVEEGLTMVEAWITARGTPAEAQYSLSHLANCRVFLQDGLLCFPYISPALLTYLKGAGAVLGHAIKIRWPPRCFLPGKSASGTSILWVVRARPISLDGDQIGPRLS